MNDHDMEKMKEGAEALGIHLTERQMDQFAAFYDLLIEKNKVMNLTAITDWDEAVTKHFLDSLLIARATDMASVRTMIDVGTGAGFPGIPLKIVYPHIQCTLADSLQKRIGFLDEVITSLGLEKIRTVHCRAEDLGKDPDNRERYDLAVSRAVASLPSLCEYCLPFVRTGGAFVSYKAADIQEEYEKSSRAIRILGGECTGPARYTIPGSSLQRSFIIIKKVRKTPGKYPRKAGTPAKDPLL